MDSSSTMASDFSDKLPPVLISAEVGYDTKGAASKQQPGQFGKKLQEVLEDETCTAFTEEDDNFSDTESEYTETEGSQTARTSMTGMTGALTVRSAATAPMRGVPTTETPMATGLGRPTLAGTLTVADDLETPSVSIQLPKDRSRSSDDTDSEDDQ